MNIKDMILTALFAAIICIIAPFSIAIGSIPLSLASFGVYLAAAALGWKRGTLSVLLYVLIGAFGLPVFSRFQGGFHVIAGLTGGYIVGYLLCAAATGWIIEIFREKIWSYILGMVIGTVLLYTLGTAWFMIQSGNSLGASLAMCVLPFLIGDGAKIVVTAVVAPKLKNAMERLPG